MSKIFSKKQVVAFLLLIVVVCGIYYFVFYDSVRPRSIPVLPASARIAVDVLRFDADLYATKDALSPFLMYELEKKYGAFPKLYIEEIIAVTSYRDPELQFELANFLTDPYIDTVHQDVFSTFDDFSDLQTQFNDAFSYLYYFFPEIEPYKVITFVSGFQFKNALMDSALLIGLDLHLGRAYTYYTQVPYLTNYLVRRLDRSNMVPEAMKLVVEDHLRPMPNSNSLGAQLIQAGKVNYALKSILPSCPDSLIFGFSAAQMDWAKDNELNLWDYLLNEDLFYNTEPQTIQRLMGDGPFTPGLPQESPARVFGYTGFRIVAHYMNRYPEISVYELFETDPMEIVKKAKYKGKSRF